MKLIFLDIDGVLNHQMWYEISEKKSIVSPEEHEKDQFCPFSVWLLNNLTNETGAKIVLSSSWRLAKTLDELKKLFFNVGITGELIGKTEKLHFQGLEGDDYISVPRGNEIYYWLKTNEDKLGVGASFFRNYVIFDDDSDMLYWQRNNYLWVDSYCGLTPNLIHKAKKILLQ